MATLARIAKDNGKAMPPGKMVAYKKVRVLSFVLTGEVCVSKMMLSSLFVSFSFHRLNKDGSRTCFLLSIAGQLLSSGLYGELE